MEPTVLHAELTGVKGMVLHRLHVQGRTLARKHQVLNHLGSFKNSAFQGLSSRPHSTQTNFRGMSSLAASTVLRAVFLLQLPIIFHLKWKQYMFSNYFQKAWFKLWLSLLWPKCIRPGRQKTPLTTAGISKQRQQGGCREATALANLLSWREGRQAWHCSSLRRWCPLPLPLQRLLCLSSRQTAPAPSPHSPSHKRDE